MINDKNNFIKCLVCRSTVYSDVNYRCYKCGFTMEEQEEIIGSTFSSDINHIILF